MDETDWKTRRYPVGRKAASKFKTICGSRLRMGHTASGAFTGLLLMLTACSPKPMLPATAKVPVSTRVAVVDTQVAKTLAELRTQLPAALGASRAVLIGQRDPNGKSVQVYQGPKATEGGYKLPPKGDPNGGPGNRMLQLYYWGRQGLATPSEDFTWHQQTFRKALEDMRRENAKAAAGIAALLKMAERLENEIAAVSPQRPAPTTVPVEATWPEYCLGRTAGAGGAESRQWAREFRSAIAALDDLHRWLELIAANHVAALDFQKLGQSLFASMDDDRSEAYVPVQAISRYPGGSLCVTALNNYFEVERQAEGLNRNPTDWASAVEASGKATADVPSAVWLTPDVRTAFVALRGRLPESLCAVWDTAPTLPYERSFVVNHLFRAQKSNTLEALGEALERSGKRFPKATMGDLMDVLVYRAGLGMSGMEWADRYDPRLMAAAGGLAEGTREQTFRAAHRWAYEQVYKGSRNYQTMVLSLRAALDTRKYDCIRGTDMVGALYRDAGGAGFLNVRWTRGDNAHTMAAVELHDADGRAHIMVLDSLLPPGASPQTWPDSYLEKRGGIYAIELNCRGLDNYLFMEGCILQGPNAGTRMRVSMPYMPGRQAGGVERVKVAE